MVFQLVPTWATLNDLERRNSFISRNSIALRAFCVTVVEDRTILSAARSLCDS